MADDRRPTTNDRSTADDRTSEDREQRERRAFMLQLAHYGHLAFVLPTATFVGWLIGVLLDRWQRTNWLYLVGLLLGIIAGFVDLIRTVMAAEKDEQ